MVSFMAATTCLHVLNIHSETTPVSYPQSHLPTPEYLELFCSPTLVEKAKGILMTVLLPVSIEMKGVGSRVRQMYYRLDSPVLMSCVILSSVKWE